MENGEIRAWNVTLLLGVPFFRNLALGNRKSAPWRLGLDSRDSPSSLTLFGSLTSPRLLFLAAQPLTPPAPSTLRHRSGQRPKTKDQDGHWFSRFIPSPVSCRTFFVFNRKRKSPRVVRMVIQHSRTIRFNLNFYKI
jgi:hypothetical protein